MKDILILINKLPHELCDIIYYYLPIPVILRVTKSNYSRYYYEYIFLKIRNHITYARNIICFDNSFTFSHYVNCCKKNIFLKKKINYKGKKYFALVDLYKNLCNYYESNKCKNIIEQIHINQIKDVFFL